MGKEHLENNLGVNIGDKIILSGKTGFGKSFIEENGSEFEVVKVMTWAEHQLLLRCLKEDCEIGLIWINFGLTSSRNFTFKLKGE